MFPERKKGRNWGKTVEVDRMEDKSHMAASMFCDLSPLSLSLPALEQSWPQALLCRALAQPELPQGEEGASPQYNLTF